MPGNKMDEPIGLQSTPHPEVFDIRAMPHQQLPRKEGQLEEFKIRQFFEKGYLVVPEFFEKEVLDACRRDVDAHVDELARSLFDNGKIKDLYEDKGLFERLAYIEKDFPGANVILHKKGDLTKAFADLWANERLLNVVEQLIGPEIMGHPVWNLRTKTPQNEATTVPWHQDSGYLDNKSYEVLQATAWIPLLDANEKNGCMEVVSGGHLSGKIAKHTCCWGNTWYTVLDEKEIEDTLNVDMQKDRVLCPVPYGGMLLINNMIPHRSLPNISNEIRWSLDLRWQRPDKDVGYYGLKNGILLRSEKTPVDKIDWHAFNSVRRHNKQSEECEEDVTTDKFDTTIVGAWMKKWEITHENTHTKRLTTRSQVAWHRP